MQEDCNRQLRQLFEDDCDDIKFSLNKDYAKKYDKWREKEEYAKLKDRYGDVEGSDSTSSDEEEDDDEEICEEEFDKDFYHTLTCLRNKDACIYDKEHSFFSNSTSALKEKPKRDKKKQDKPLFLKDYEREFLLNHGGQISDDDEEEETIKLKEFEENQQTLTYVEEQKMLKDNFKKVVPESDDDELFIKHENILELKSRPKEIETNKMDDALLNKINTIWNDEADEKEKLLRNYLVNKEYVDDYDKQILDWKDHVESSEDSEESSEDSEESSADMLTEHQEEASSKTTHNFRFEEPDQQFIKRYPRVIPNSLRKQDETRRLKRSEVIERKRREKERKRNEIKRLKALKRKEIQERIEKIKNITGNTKVAFDIDELNEDFDPTEHDKKMQEMFDDEFYNQGDCDGPPIFEDGGDDEYEDNWDNWESTKGDNTENQDGGEELHFEDPNFNMDCDYDPNAEVVQSQHKFKRNKRFRKGKLIAALEKKKPVFDPSHSSFENYLNEYYELDYEDNIGDLLCRFKYRSVVPNDFGLSTEEVLAADDKELNEWCSIKKMSQHRLEEDEKYDIKKYLRKGKNIHKKANILKSIFKRADENDNADNQTDDTSRKKKRKKKTPSKEFNSRMEKRYDDSNRHANDNFLSTFQSKHETQKKSKRRQNSNQYANNEMPLIPASRLRAYGFKSKKLKSLKYSMSKLKS